MREIREMSSQKVSWTASFPFSRRTESILVEHFLFLHSIAMSTCHCLQLEKTNTVQSFTIKRHALSTWTTLGHVHRSILRHYSRKLHTCSVFLQFLEEFFLFCFYFGWPCLVLQRVSNSALNRRSSKATQNLQLQYPLIISSFNKLTRAHHVTERDNLTTDDFLTGKVVDFVAGVVCLFLTDCLVPRRLRLRRNKRRVNF